ncbi:MAG TPA: hypothetical protein VJ729_12950 [Nitrososphaeraceae archaeon]|nr:hypothetical protein [Nitrososphaeraceae archaeon]
MPDDAAKVALSLISSTPLSYFWMSRTCTRRDESNRILNEQDHADLKEDFDGMILKRQHKSSQM